MSNVRIEATGEDDLSVEIMLGDANRGWYDIKAGESADLAVGGNQTLSVDLASAPQVVVKRGVTPQPFITPDDEPAKDTPWVTGDDGEDVPLGVDVQAEDEGREAQSIGAGDVGDIGALFGGSGVGDGQAEGGSDAEVGYSGGDEAQAEIAVASTEAKVEGGSEAEAEVSVISNLEADSPLEVGSLSDLPSPFDVDSDESIDVAVEEAEDTDGKAQA